MYRTCFTKLKEKAELEGQWYEGEDKINKNYFVLNSVMQEEEGFTMEELRQVLRAWMAKFNQLRL